MATSNVAGLPSPYDALPHRASLRISGRGQTIAVGIDDFCSRPTSTTLRQSGRREIAPYPKPRILRRGVCAATRVPKKTSANHDAEHPKTPNTRYLRILPPRNNNAMRNDTETHNSYHYSFHSLIQFPSTVIMHSMFQALFVKSSLPMPRLLAIPVREASSVANVETHCATAAARRRGNAGPCPTAARAAGVPATPTQCVVKVGRFWLRAGWRCG
jgi:hypothetical protein